MAKIRRGGNPWLAGVCCRWEWKITTSGEKIDQMPSGRASLLLRICCFCASKGLYMEIHWGIICYAKVWKESVWNWLNKLWSLEKCTRSIVAALAAPSDTLLSLEQGRHHVLASV